MPLIQAGDLNVYYREQGEVPSGPEPVVFVHGNWVTGLEWEPVLQRLPADWHAIAPDVRGRGQTTGPDSDYTIPALAADLRAFVDALGLDRFHLVGHSLGSAIAMQFALDAPDRLKTLTIIAPAWVDGMPAAYNVPAGQQMAKDDKAFYAQALKFQAPTLAEDDFWQRLVDEGHEQRITATLANLDACLNWKPGDQLRALAMPVLLVSGALDALTGGANAERAAAALNTRAIVIEGVGHSPNMEAPDQFLALLLPHLQGENASTGDNTQHATRNTESPLLPGITSAHVETPRLTSRVLTSGPADGIPVVLVDGNVSSARWWEETMLALPPAYRAIALDLRGYGATEAKPIDATRGVRDWSDDLKALVDTLQLGQFHLVGWSMGGGIAMQYALDHPGDLRSITLVAPMSPFGFGGTKDAAGTPCYDDFAGSGGGTANPEFVQRLAAGDRSADSPVSPRNVMLAHYFKPPFRPTPEREEVFLSDMLATRVGDGFYPGDMTASPNWPTVAPGTQGPNNAMSPKYCNLSGFAALAPRPPVLWVRGADDVIVSDTSFYDFGFLGQLGAVPGWPGAETVPPQPMVAQMRGVLDAYQAAGGHYWEKLLADCGHAPLVEHPTEFQALLLAHLRDAQTSDEQ